MIQGMFDSGALPVLHRLVQFTEERHKVLTNNVANLSTPYFKPGDLDAKSFQTALGRAIDKRRAAAHANDGPLALRDTRQLMFRPDRLEVRPQATNDGILYHDQNNRDLERTMQQLAENTLAHNAAIEMLRNQFAMIQTAIRERVA